jgi:hypothetical protein
VVLVDLLQGADHRLGVVGQRRRAQVGAALALAADRPRQHERRGRRQDRHDQGDQQHDHVPATAAAAATATAAHHPAKQHAAEHHARGDHRKAQQHGGVDPDQRVAAGDVADLVSGHGLDLAALEGVQQPRGERDLARLGAAAHREGVQRVVVDDEHLRGGDAGGHGHALDDVGDAGLLGDVGVGLAGAGGAQHRPVGDLPGDRHENGGDDHPHPDHDEGVGDTEDVAQPGAQGHHHQPDADEQRGRHPPVAVLLGVEIHA